VEWTQLIHRLLNPNEPPLPVAPPCETPLFHPSIQVITSSYQIPIASIDVGDWVLDEHQLPTRVLGIIRGRVEGDPGDKQWNTAYYAKQGDKWVLQPSTLSVKKGSYHIGLQLITESGTFMIYHGSEKREKTVRDFTEVGHQAIENTYVFIAEQLRSKTNDDAR
jgi:hypothetical protein